MGGKKPTFLDDLINLHSKRLTHADARLLEVIVGNPIRAAMENGKEVSFRAGVHPASAVRLARRLGFAGYPEFRRFLQEGLVRGHSEFDDPAVRIAARLARAKAGGLLSSVIGSEIAALQELRQSVSDDEIRPFSIAIFNARRILLFGASHASSLCMLLALRLRRSGYDATDLSAQQHQYFELLLGVGPEDVLWLINFQKMSPIMGEICTIAAASGAKILALTSESGAQLSPAPHHAIVASRRGAGESQSLIATVAVMNTVILDLAAIDEGRTVHALAALRNLRSSTKQN